ncbi:MAG: oligosaccharide flippase family protein [Patescibacteria group bacterium]
MEELDIGLITKRSIRGVLALISRNLVINLLSFGASLVIFTILTPQEVGIYIGVIAIQRVISFLTDFGLGAALVQKKDSVSQNDITTIFTIQGAATFVLFLLVLALREPIMTFFRMEEIGGRLLVVLVFTIFLASFKTIPSILLERAINFQKHVIPQIAESFVFNLLLIVLLLLNYKIDSFSIAFLVSSIISIPLYYCICPWKLRLGIHKKSLAHLRYGIQFQAKNVLATLKDDLLIIFLWRVFSSVELGFIGFGQRFAFFAYRYIVDSVTKVTFSTYARLQHDRKLLTNAIEKSLFYVSSVMFPSLFGLIIAAPYTIQYFPKWNNKWEPAIFSLIFFCLNAAVSSLSGILVNVLDATGKVKTTLRLMVLWTFLVWILTPILIFFYGYNGVSVASFLVTTTIVYTVFLVKKFVDFKFFGSIYKPAIATVFMSVVVFIFSQVLVKDFLSLIFVILIGGAVYIFSLFAIAKKELISGIKQFGIKL